MYHGVFVQDVNKYKNGTIDVTVDIEANGYGAVLMLNGKQYVDEQLLDLLKEMNMLTRYPIESYSTQWNVLNQNCIVHVGPKTGKGAPGMIEIPAFNNWIFTVHGIEIEGWNLTGIDFQYPWEKHPNRYHNLTISLDRFWIDKHPVTNQEYYSFLKSSGYTPKDTWNYLKDWSFNHESNIKMIPVPPAGWENKPVTWVSLTDAKAFCEYNNKRLPNEWEWQYAAQGSNYNYLYPWGTTWNASNVPAVDTSRNLTPPEDVGTHPGGASTFGVEDLIGLVWQYTNEFIDDHTRACSLRGGSYYQPQGSRWYFPQAYSLNEHGKYLLFSDSYDRAGTLGFRCVKE